MAARTEIKTKTFFQIPPDIDSAFNWEPDRVVFMDQGFDLNHIKHISTVYEEGPMQYVFFVYLGYSDELRLRFEFRRKGDALMAQRELTRAWTRTGEFAPQAEEGQDSN